MTRASDSNRFFKSTPPTGDVTYGEIVSIYLIIQHLGSKSNRKRRFFLLFLCQSCGRMVTDILNKKESFR